MYPTIVKEEEAESCDKDVSLGLGSVRDESKEEAQVFKVVEDKKPGDLHLKECRLDFGHEVVGGLLIR